MSSEKIHTIYVKDLAHLLGVTDLRTAKRWCRLNSVAILTDRGRRVSYVVRSEYEAARLSAFIKLLKNRHGKDWFIAFHAHVDFNIELLSTMHATNGKKQSGRSFESLDNTGKHEQRFLESLTSLK